MTKKRCKIIELLVSNENSEDLEDASGQTPFPYIDQLLLNSPGYQISGGINIEEIKSDVPEGNNLQVEPMPEEMLGLMVSQKLLQSFPEEDIYNKMQNQSTPIIDPYLKFKCSIRLSQEKPIPIQFYHLDRFQPQIQNLPRHNQTENISQSHDVKTPLVFNKYNNEILHHQTFEPQIPNPLNNVNFQTFHYKFEPPLIRNCNMQQNHLNPDQFIPFPKDLVVDKNISQPELFFISNNKPLQDPEMRPAEDEVPYQSFQKNQIIGLHQKLKEQDQIATAGQQKIHREIQMRSIQQSSSSCDLESCSEFFSMDEFPESPIYNNGYYVERFHQNMLDLSGKYQNEKPQSKAFEQENINTSNIVFTGATKDKSFKNVNTKAQP